MLDPHRISHYRLPALASANIMGGQVTYALHGPATGPLVIYFHGWGDDYRVVLPLEHALIAEGFQLLVMHRPGYAGTELRTPARVELIDRGTPSGCAQLAAGLLDHLHHREPWRVSVIGMSGGAPAALAFASLYPAQTEALVIQAGVTQPWSDAKFVPEIFRDNYLTAFEQFGWAGNGVSQVVFGMLVKLRENFLGDDDKLRALAGTRLQEARCDAAFAAVASTILREDAQNRNGELNDARSIFFAQEPYCDWQGIKTPTLLIHDKADPFVPYEHAQAAKMLLTQAQLRTFDLGGHMIWLGHEAVKMHKARVAFLKRGE